MLDLQIQVQLDTLIAYNFETWAVKAQREFATPVKNKNFLSECVPDWTKCLLTY